MTLRYDCLSLDGNVHRFEDNPMPRWSALVAQCRTVEAIPDTEPSPAATVPDVVVIVRRGAEHAGKTGTSDSTMQELPANIAELVEAAAQRYEVDARVVRAVIQVESAYDTRARSPKGALGLMQLMPATAQRLGARPAANLFDPALNIELGVRYLRLLGNLFGDRLELVLAAYNAGEGAVIRHGMRVPPYRETEAYVRKITTLLMD